MIFVTVGSQKFQFDRLLKKVDQLVADGIISEEVFAQTGVSGYQPRCFRWQPFCGRTEFAKLVEGCDIMITHGGTGAIISAVKGGKKVIAVPRLARYGEHVDDHQLQLLQQFDKLNLICVCSDENRLPEALQMVRTHRYDSYRSNTEAYIASLDEFIRAVGSPEEGGGRT